MNDYGVHPFAPFWPHWLYGGFIFIVEPLLIASLLPLLVLGFQSSSRINFARALGAFTTAVLLGLLWFTQVLTWPVALANTLFLAFSFWAQKRRPGIAQPIAFAGSVLVVFAVMSHMAAQRVRDKISQEQPEEKITQLVTTPLPGNPFCWQVIPVTRLDMDGMAGQISGQTVTPYFERLGVVSLWPSAFAPETCYFRTEIERTAPLMKASLSADAHMFWVGEFRGTVESLSASAAQYCRFEQFLRWARVPFYFKMPGNVLLGGDLRYDREPGLGFAEHEFQPGEPCLEHAPNWDSPSGLLQSGLQRKQ
jgi:inner membrane protein